LVSGPDDGRLRALDAKPSLFLTAALELPSAPGRDFRRSSEEEATVKVLVIYATVDGQTGKIARFILDEVNKLGHKAVLIDADDQSEISFAGADAVILAASVHQRRHPKNFETFLAEHKADLEKQKTLLMSVSLSAAFPEGLEEAGEYVIEMKMRTGFTSDAELLVGGAIRSNDYDYFAKQVVRHVVLRNRPYDPNEGEHEFTDWQVLSSEISKFIK
jgi:menaquinone-dependent protoporphyrinogen oxidase